MKKSDYLARSKMAWELSKAKYKGKHLRRFWKIASWHWLFYYAGYRG